MGSRCRSLTDAWRYGSHMERTAGSIVRTFDLVWDRLLTRISGLGREEYFWEPVPGCWSLRPDDKGRWILDGDGGGGPTPDPIPVTTIVWRLGHIAGTVGGFARMRFGDGQPLTADELEVPADPDGVPSFLTAHYRAWMDACSLSLRPSGSSRSARLSVRLLPRTRPTLHCTSSTS